MLPSESLLSLAMDELLLAARSEGRDRQVAVSMITGILLMLLTLALLSP